MFVPPKRIVTAFVVETGQIMRWGPAAEGAEREKCREGEDWIEGEWDNTHWRIDPVTRAPLALEPMPLTIATNKVTGIPPGTMAMVNCQRVAVDDGQLIFTVTLPQTIIVPLHHPLFQQIDIEVTCAPD